MINLFRSLFSRKKDKEVNPIKEETTDSSFQTKEEFFDRDKYTFNKSYEYDQNQDLNSLKYQIQILNSKMDAILAKLDNLIMRVSYLENFINSLFYRR